jgi:Zn-dependent protease
VRGSFKLLTLWGIPLRVHFSLLLVVPFLAFGFSWGFQGGALAFLWGLGLALALFLSVLVHELAHCFYARRQGGEVSDITLFILGGVSRITRMPEGHKHEALMALAGPATSLGLGVLLLVMAVPLGGVDSGNWGAALASLGRINLLLGVFNLLPAFPMDGGRILRAALSGKLGRVRATQVAGFVGRAFALLFGLIALLGIPGVLPPNPFLLLIAFFVYLGAASESREVLLQSLLTRVRVREVMVARTASVDAGDSLATVALRMRAERRRVLPVVEDGRVVGLVTLATVRRVPAPRREQLLAREVTLPAPLLTPESTAWEALRELGLHRLPQLPVVREGVLVGTVTQDDISRLMELRELEDTSPHGPWGPGPRESPT